ncbi:MAG: hypothetical protein ACI8UO_005897 [Verrucomicrobiales bacterium]|jgi:hypothetical protein
MKTNSLLTLLASGSALLALAVCSPLAWSHDGHKHDDKSAVSDDSKPKAKAAHCSACKRPAPPQSKPETVEPRPPAVAAETEVEDAKAEAKSETEAEVCPITDAKDENEYLFHRTRFRLFGD